MSFEQEFIDALVPQEPPLEPDERMQLVDDTRAFIQRCLASAAPHIGLGVWLMRFLLRIWLLVMIGPGSLRGPDKDKFEGAVLRFERLGTSFYSLTRLYRSLVMLSYFEHPLVTRRIGAPDLLMVQKTHRELRAGLVLKESSS